MRASCFIPLTSLITVSKRLCATKPVLNRSWTTLHMSIASVYTYVFIMRSYNFLDLRSINVACNKLSHTYMGIAADIRILNYNNIADLSQHINALLSSVGHYGDGLWTFFNKHQIKYRYKSNFHGRKLW